MTFAACELVHQIMRGRLALDGRVQREQHLFDLRIARPLDQLGDGEILGADAVERRERAAEHVIEPVEHGGALERPEIADLLDHADERAVARVVAAERAGLCVSILPQVSQVRMVSRVSASAAASGPSSCSFFLTRASAARRAERGPSPGSRASSWISRSISGPAATRAMSHLALP